MIQEPVGSDQGRADPDAELDPFGGVLKFRDSELSSHMLNALAHCNSTCAEDALLAVLVSLKVDRRRVEVKHVWRAARFSGAASSVTMGG